jgi:hypothetical protein
VDLTGRTPDTMRLGQAIESADSELKRCIIKEKKQVLQCYGEVGEFSIR